MEPTLLTPISAEFSNVDLGDARLNRRLLRVAEAAERAPGASLPVQAGSAAALEATYRFLGNDRVSARAVFDGHVEATLDRAMAEREVFVIHDTTEFRFGGEQQREGMGWLNSDYQQGFLAHFSFCVSRAGRPLGSLGLFAWSRHGTRKGRLCYRRRTSNPDRESLRWEDAALLTRELLHDKVESIHLMDREGDSYELIALLLEYEQRFVIRVGHDRRLQPGRGTPASPKLYEALDAAPRFFEREVDLSARGKPDGSNKTGVFPARRRRVARLEVRAETREIFAAHNAQAHLPRSMTLNFVTVCEIDPPEEAEPVLWRLVTTEPIGTAKQIAAVIDAYRQRWIVEEFFKALKTGCRYQQLQLESGRGLLVALAIEAAIAWRILLLRWVTHNEPQGSASRVLPKEQIALLRRLARQMNGSALPRRLTVQTALLLIACLGGHIKNNGPPGWLVLRRGLDTLLTIQRGWNLAQGG